MFLWCLQRKRCKILKIYTVLVIYAKKTCATYGRYIKVELSAENKKMLYVPEGFAHGYLVLSKFSIVLYKCTNIYNPGDEYGIKWDDPDLNINWGDISPLVSEKDNALPYLKEQKYLPTY